MTKRTPSFRGKYKTRKDKGIRRGSYKPRQPSIRSSKFVRDSVWTGPTGPNLWRENPTAYTQMHRFVKQKLPPTDLCRCGESATDVSCLDNQYNPNDLTQWAYSCHTCNIQLSPVVMGWWWTNGELNRRSVKCPGEGWWRGRAKVTKFENLTTMGKWKRRNGTSNRIGGKPGRQLGFYWNNGQKMTVAFECPGEGWVRGGLPRKKSVNE